MITLTLPYIRETKNKFVFGDEASEIQSLYIDKTAFPNGCPNAIKVEIEDAEDE